MLKDVNSNPSSGTINEVMRYGTMDVPASAQELPVLELRREKILMPKHLANLIILHHIVEIPKQNGMYVHIVV